MALTFTISESETYSEADVKAVMKNTYEDIIGFANRDMITYSTAKTWIEDLIFILNKNALKFFEIKIYTAGGTWLKAYRYEVSSGYFVSSAPSGGINYFDFPDNSHATLYAELDYANRNATEVNRILHEERGWGTGAASQGIIQKERSYVSGNLALNRSVIQ
ncbi:MAG TPA: hypothetical protein VG737_09855 [Cyclobacteriaceae bacterium]|nr:hypothetical protein [Cyclobacteriaceae bacterium]